MQKRNFPYTKNELIYMTLVMVLPITFAYVFHRESILEFIIYLGIGMLSGFFISIALVLSINRSYEKKSKNEDFSA